MKIPALFLAVAGGMLSGCLSVDYFGDKCPPTSDVKIFYREQDVPPNLYRALGRGIINVEPKFSEGVTELFRDKAMQVGADAVLIKGFIEIKPTPCPATARCLHQGRFPEYELRAEFLKKRSLLQTNGKKP